MVEVCSNLLACSILKRQVDNTAMLRCTNYVSTTYTSYLRKPRTALFSLSSARLVFRVWRPVFHVRKLSPHADTRFRMRRLVFRVRRTVSACGDWCSANGELSFICTLYFFLQRLSSTPRRLHFNLVQLDIISRVAGSK